MLREKSKRPGQRRRAWGDVSIGWVSTTGRWEAATLYCCSTACCPWYRRASPCVYHADEAASQALSRSAFVTINRTLCNCYQFALCSCSSIGTIFMCVLHADEAANQALSRSTLITVNRGTVLDLSGGKQLKFIPVPTPRWPDLVGACLCFCGWGGGWVGAESIRSCHAAHSTRRCPVTCCAHGGQLCYLD